MRTDHDCETIGIASIDLAQVSKLDQFFVVLQWKVYKSSYNASFQTFSLVSPTGTSPIGELSLSLDVFESLAYFLRKK